MPYHSYVTRDRGRWNAYVDRSLISEVYHTWHYHSLNKEGEPILFVVDFNGDFIAFPFIKRTIGNTPFFDLTSVYGYAGPISNVDLATIPLQWIAFFKSSFMEFMDAEKCVCVFSRLHPFINQHVLIQGLGGIRENGRTIYVDLRQTEEMQRSKYHKRLFRQIKQLNQVGYTIKEGSSPQEIKAFTSMYHENMDRLKASRSYYFDEQYFTDLLSSDEFQSRLILIYKGSELICGAVIFLSDHVVRNHLSATAEAYLNESPSKLLTDQISMIGRAAGSDIFHLGGGVGGKADSLFIFKSYFSDLQIEDRIWCYIHNQKVYDDLVQTYTTDLEEISGYFPAYRQGLLTNSLQSY